MDMVIVGYLAQRAPTGRGTSESHPGGLSARVEAGAVPEATS
jgi:hypothetical protein